MRGWLTPKPDPDFETKCADICTVYLEAPEAAKQGVRTVSIDEMSGVQALERAALSLPMTSGKIERREYEYRRHGTQALIAAFEISTGQVQGTVGDTRTEEDYVRFLEDLFASSRINDAMASGVRQSEHACLGGRGPPGCPAMWD